MPYPAVTDRISRPARTRVRTRPRNTDREKREVTTGSSAVRAPCASRAILDGVDVLSAIVTLFLVMDPLGNVPLFLSVLKSVPQERRQRVLVRELLFAYIVLVVFLLIGGALLRFLGLGPEAVRVAGGIVLFLIALRMIFPDHGSLTEGGPEGEPFVVPLAIPLVAGPSTLATLLLLDRIGARRDDGAAVRGDGGVGVDRRDPALVDVLLPGAGAARTHRDGAAHGDAARDGVGADAHGWHRHLPAVISRGSALPHRLEPVVDSARRSGRPHRPAPWSAAHLPRMKASRSLLSCALCVSVSPCGAPG